MKPFKVFIGRVSEELAKIELVNKILEGAKFRRLSAARPHEIHEVPQELIGQH
jgi:hypothetical protein